MEAFSNVFSFIAGVPAIIGLFLTALFIALSSDWRLSLLALLVQYVLAGLTLTRFIRPEVAVVKILVGTLTVLIFYLTALHVHGPRRIQESEEEQPHALRRWLGWDGGPMGLVLRLLAVLLVVLALIQLFGELRLPLVSTDIAFAAIWLASMGILGLVLGGGPLRVAPAALTILTGFDLLYATLEPSLAAVGLIGALTLLSALAFSYLALVQAANVDPKKPDEEAAEL